MSLFRTKSKAPSKPSVPLPAVAFVVTFLLSWLLLRTSSSSLYAPLTSPKYHPPPQPPSAAVILNSIVVPAYHERSNVRPLAERVFQAVAHPEETELIIVDDDSRDGTVEEVSRLKEEGYNVELLVRVGENGLSSAVLRGFEVARGSRLVVMDADLQVSSSRRRNCFFADLTYTPAPSRDHPTPARLPLGQNSHRAWHSIRRGRFHVEGLAPLPSHHLVGCSSTRSSSHQR